MSISERMKAAGFQITHENGEWVCYISTHNGGDGFIDIRYKDGNWRMASAMDDDGMPPDRYQFWPVTEAEMMEYVEKVERFNASDCTDFRRFER